MFSLSSILAWLLTISNFAFSIFLYFTIVIYLLSDEKDLSYKVARLLPIDSKAKRSLVMTLNDSIKGIFLSNLQIAIFQAVYTWVLFDLA